MNVLSIINRYDQIKKMTPAQRKGVRCSVHSASCSIGTLHG